MTLSYADLTTRVLQFLQDTGAATYDSTETDYAIRNELKRLSRYAPVIIEGLYKIESRTGVDTAGTANKLTDSTKSQFVAADETLQKAVHNTTEDTWAVVKNYDSASVLTLSRDIMNDGDSYQIYNRYCVNKRQVNLGLTPEFLWIDSVEYPINTERNFHQTSWHTIEIDVDDSAIPDSDPTEDPPNNVRILVRFAFPQVVSQLTDWDGELSGAAAEGATTISIDGMGTTETIKVGELFNLEDHITTYTVTTEVTMVAGAGNLVFFPALEAAALNNDDITFIKSTLQPNLEDLLERMVASRAVQSNSINYINATNLGGPKTMQDYQQWINNNPLLSPVLLLRELEALAHPKSAKILART